jgi:hypothetical protein
VEEAKASKLPNVFVDLELTTPEVKFVVGNSGSAPATKITFNVVDNIPWRKIGGGTESIADLVIVKKGISYLAPQRTLKYSAGYLSHGPEAFEDGSQLEVALSFSSEDGKAFKREFVINLSQYTSVLLESFKGVFGNYRGRPQHLVFSLMREGFITFQV